MAQLAFLFKVKKTKIGAIEVEATISESHQADADVTEHPVENGANISDHIRPKPRTLTIEGFISNTPAESIVETGFDTFPKGTPGRADEAMTKLLEIRSSGELVRVATRFITYENMAMTSLSFPRDAKVGDGLRFSASFKEVQLVDLKTVELAPPRAQSKKNRGNKPSQQASAAVAAQEDNSILFGLYYR